MKIEMGKKYTSDGHNVTILCTNRNNKDYPIIGLLEDGSVRYFAKNGENTAWDAWNLVEEWEPHLDEWCLFWDNDEKQHYVVLYRFIGMTDCGRFKSDNCISWKYCAKFDGTLPKHMREAVK